MAFKDRLIEVRCKMKLSQSDLARKTGIQPSAISHFESGRRQPNLSNFRKLCEVLYLMPVEYLLEIGDRVEDGRWIKT
jgi:transcriptional regulator with XRE-family HTH domain